MQAPDEIAQLRQRLLRLLVRGRHGIAHGRVGFSQRGAGDAEIHRQRHQPLLGAVVQVALDPTTLGVGRLDRRCPAGRQRLDAPGEHLGGRRLQQRPAQRQVGRGGAAGEAARGHQQPRSQHDVQDPDAEATRASARGGRRGPVDEVELVLERRLRDGRDGEADRGGLDEVDQPARRVRVLHHRGGQGELLSRCCLEPSRRLHGRLYNVEQHEPAAGTCDRRHYDRHAGLVRVRGQVDDDQLVPHFDAGQIGLAAPIGVDRLRRN
jgi:hypothetical protein